MFNWIMKQIYGQCNKTITAQDIVWGQVTLKCELYRDHDGKHYAHTGKLFKYWEPEEQGNE
jgi:hypothetical protein